MNTYKDRSYGGSDHTLFRKFSEGRARSSSTRSPCNHRLDKLEPERKDEQIGDFGTCRRVRDGCAHAGF